MSNATQHSQPSGDSRRRRSRGGRNRNNNNQNQENRRGGERGDRENRGSRDNNRGAQSGRSEEFRPQAPRRTYAPPKLTFWQKLLQMVGLYKAPTPPARAERKPDAPRQDGNRPQAEARTPKSNTRNARSNESATGEKSGERTRERSEERPPKRERGNRNTGDRPRGGDGSTVESPRVYVGNLSYDVSEQDLQELFKGIGPVRNVEIVYNRSTHRSKGYGFVEMLHKDEAVRSVEVLHDQPFMGRKLVVSGAKSKGQDEREDMESRDEGEPRKVVVAPIPPAAAAVAVATEAPASPVYEAEPLIQTIVENVTEATAEEIPAVAEAAEDLVNKYSFDEPKEETKEA